MTPYASTHPWEAGRDNAPDWDKTMARDGSHPMWVNTSAAIPPM